MASFVLSRYHRVHFICKYFVHPQRWSSFQSMSLHNPCTILQNRMEVITLTALSDNYMYVLVDKVSKACAAVDPVEPVKILATVKEHSLHLTSILTTHHHTDHAGGNNEMVSIWKKLTGKDLPVHGGDKRIEGITQQVKDGDKLKIGNNLSVKCLATPCHTTGHICYYVTDESPGDSNGVVFTGDTLFLGGCGRFFEGTADEMYRSLIECLAKLPENTQVYCGHEYTARNLEFGLTVEPNNQATKKRLNDVRQTRESGRPTVPGTIGEELATNPFMRVSESTVLAHANTTSPVEAMGIIRKEKDNF